MTEQSLAKVHDVGVETPQLPAQPPVVQLGVIQAPTAKALVTCATDAAKELAQVIRQQKLAVKIQGREYVRCEGWTTLGAMLGVTPHEVGNTEQDGIYTSIVELRRMVDGAVVSRASAECGAADELDRNGNPTWSARPRYARRSMAATRAAAKAHRLCFSWVMALAGYEPTPAEEMDGVIVNGQAVSEPAKPKRVTYEQVKQMHARLKKSGLDIDRFNAYMRKATGAERIEDLTASQYSKLDAPR